MSRLDLAICLLLAACMSLSSTAAPKKAAVEKEEEPPPPLSEKQVEKLRGYSVEVAEKVMAHSQKEIESIRSRRKPLPGDKATRLKYEMTYEYSKLYLERLQAHRDLVAYQETCVKQKLSGEEAIAKLEEYGAAYNAANKRMSELSAQHLTLFKTPIRDPYQIVLERIFEPKGTAN